VNTRRDEDPELLARIAWSLCAEPGDPAAVAVVAALGAVEAWRWLLDVRELTPTAAARSLRSRVRERDGSAPGDASTGCRREDGDADEPGRAGLDDRGRALRSIARALGRWLPRVDEDPRATLGAARRIGAVPLIPGRPGWPDRLADLGPTAPLCLWVRGDPRLDVLVDRSVALVGARAASEYGELVAGDLAGGLAGTGVCVLSGGAYGIDAAAHRGVVAVRTGAPTVALLAGGPDRLSPAGNADLLRRVIDQGGAVVAESPPGRPPSRSQFLLRNRLIAALTCATVVVEAGWRSGALSTAHHAGELLRPVGAVPGPVTSPASAGCHRLLRSGAAVCVTEVADVLELLGPATTTASADDAPHGVDGTRVGGAGDAPGRADRVPGGGVAETLGVPAPAWSRAGGETAPHSRRARVLDALGRHPAGVPTVAARAGLAVAEVEAELGLLELGGLARRTREGRWSRERVG
jgi:DNA processing protein